jgi:hypothetical protein
MRNLQHADYFANGIQAIINVKVKNSFIKKPLSICLKAASVPTVDRGWRF